MAIYAYRSGHSVSQLDPQAVGDELERIRAEKGSLKPEFVVEAAQEDGNPLHDGFDWDNEKAAHQHRLQQARRMIVAVRIIDGPVQIDCPAFVSIRSAEVGRSYVPTVAALTDAELRARVLMEARQAIESLRRRYAAFESVADVLDRLSKNVG